MIERTSRDDCKPLHITSLFPSFLAFTMSPFPIHISSGPPIASLIHAPHLSVDTLDLRDELFAAAEQCATVRRGFHMSRRFLKGDHFGAPNVRPDDASI